MFMDMFEESELGCHFEKEISCWSDGSSSLFGQSLKIFDKEDKDLNTNEIIQEEKVEYFEEKGAEFLDQQQIPPYLDDPENSNYLEQFLNSTDGCKNLNGVFSMQTEQENIDNLFSEAKGGSFHNFQKHLLTTLRQWVNRGDFQEHPETRGLQYELWEIFMKSDKKPRNLIHLITGGINFEEKKSKKLQKDYGIDKIVKNRSEKAVQKAQKIIRAEIVRQCEKKDFEYYLKSRRIKNKQGFQAYFDQFIKELKRGKVKKRAFLPNISTIQLIEQKKQDFQGLSFNKA